MSEDPVFVHSVIWNLIILYVINNVYSFQSVSYLFGVSINLLPIVDTRNLTHAVIHSDIILVTLVKYLSSFWFWNILITEWGGQRERERERVCVCVYIYIYTPVYRELSRLICSAYSLNTLNEIWGFHGSDREANVSENVGFYQPVHTVLKPRRISSLNTLKIKLSHYSRCWKCSPLFCTHSWHLH
jgi:hypothetical protein